MTDPAGKWKKTASDMQGNTVQVTEPDPSGNSSGLITNYTYDVMEHLTQVSMPRGSVTQTRTFTYSSSTHLLTSETHPETGTTSYAYYTGIQNPDPATNDLLYSKTDAKGQVTKYDYDAYDRVVVIHRYPSGLAQAEDVCQKIAYSYDAFTDANSSFSSNSAQGRVAAVTTGDPTQCSVQIGSVSVPQQFVEMYNYTQSGHVATKRLELYQANGTSGSPGNYVTQWWDVSYGYNPLGQVTTTTYPSAGAGSQNQLGSPVVAGQTYTVGYDLMDRPVNLHDSRQNGGGWFYPVQGVAYNATDQPVQTEFQLSAGFTGSTNANFWENRGYNVQNQLTVINNFNTSATVVNGTVGLTYTYSGTQNNGQITGGTTGGGSVTDTFTYDALKRLTAATAVTSSGATQWSQMYSYDGFGNMTSKTGSGLTFTISSNANNQLIGNFCYDNNGNLASDQYSCNALNYTPSYTYDVANRMVSAKVSGGTEHYIYDADNKRISTISANGTQTVFIYGAGGEKLSVAGPGGGSGISNNVYFAGRLIKQNTDVFGASGPSNLDDHFVAVDRLGSVKSSYQLFGTAYMPYGEESVTSPNDQMKFATYTRDSSTGLDYADQRFYTSQFGRFMSADRYKKSADPSNPGSWNRFIYSFNDPVNLSDPTGRSPSKDVDNCSIDANPEDDDCEDGNGDTGGGGGGVTFSVTGTCGEECGDEDGSGGNDTSGGSTDTASAGSGAFGPPLTTTALPCPQQRILNATGLTPQGPPISVGGHNQFPVTMRPGQQPPGFSPFKIFGINNGYRTTNTLKSVHISVNGSQPGTYQAHIDIFNPATGLLGILGHLVWDMGLGTTLQTLGAPSGVLDPKCN